MDISGYNEAYKSTTLRMFQGGKKIELFWNGNNVEVTAGGRNMGVLAGKEGPKGDTYIPTQAWASDANGTGWSLTPSDSLKYSAFIPWLSTNPTPPTSGDYAGAKWQKVVGDDGSIDNIDDEITDGSTKAAQSGNMFDEFKRVKSIELDFYNTQDNVDNDLTLYAGSRANYGVSNWIFIPKTQISSNGYINKFSVFLTNTQAGRTVQFFIFDGVTNTFTIDKKTEILSAELSGVNEFTLANEIRVSKDQYIGCLITTPNTSNSIGFWATFGQSYTEYGGWYVISPSVNIGDLLNGVVESEQRFFDIKAYGYSILDSTKYTTEADFLAEHIYPLNKSIENIAVNTDILSGAVANFGVTNWMFIPKNLFAPADGYISEFTMKLTNAQVGRTVEFFILTKNGIAFTNAYKTGSIPAESANFNHSLLSAIKINANQYIGCLITTPNTSNSLSFLDTGGPSYANYGGWSIASPIALIDGVNNADVQPGSRGFNISCVFIEDIIVKSNKSNVPNGYVGLNDTKKIPSEISFEHDLLAGKKIVWVGTSIPAGGNPTYPSLVGKYLNATVINNAIGESGVVWNGTRAKSLSATIAELQSAYPGYENNSYQNLIIGTNADLIVIDHGYNDITFAQSNLGAIDSVDRSTFYGSFNYVIQAALIDNPDVRFVFITAPNRYVNIGASITLANFDAMTTAIKTLAQKYNAPVIDLAVICNINNLNYTQYKVDTVHPIEADRQRLAYLIYRQIKNYF